MSGILFYPKIYLIARLHVAAQHTLMSRLNVLHKIDNAALSKLCKEIDYYGPLSF